MSDKNTNNVDQIRDLIFGSQLKEFEKRFAQLDTRLEDLEREIIKSVNESHTKLKNETEQSLEILEKRIDNLDTTSQKDRAALKELISTNDEALIEKLNIQKDEFDTKIRIVKDNIATQSQNSDSRIEEIKNSLEELIIKNIKTLSDEKLSRDTMAQMLLDTAMKIQGTDITETLIQGNNAEE
jgi:hypothetical protein